MLVSNRMPNEPKSWSGTTLSLSEILLLAVWFGSLSGLAEVVLLAAKKYYVGKLIFVSRDFVWMAPLADAGFLSALAVLLFMLKYRWRTMGSLQTAVFLFSCFGFLSCFLHIGKLHVYALFVLAAGLAAQVARVVVRHAGGFHWLMRRTTGGILLLIALLCMAAISGPKIREHQAIANLPAPPPGAPNVLLIVLDTVRALDMSLYGYNRQTTPNLERIAKDAVVFDQAISTAPWTLPSHASMFTGRLPKELSVSWLRALDETYPTLAEALRVNGYLTGGFVGNIWFCSSETGLDRGFVRYDDHRISLGQVIGSSILLKRMVEQVRQIMGFHDELTRKAAPELNSDFLNWLDSRNNRPFFAFINYYDAHEPFLPPKPFSTFFGSDRPSTNPRLAPGGTWRLEDVQRERDAYDGAIRYLDEQIGSLIEELRRRGILQNTLLIITADHGEEFFEHDIMGHGYSLYLSNLHVPLLIIFPSRVPAGQRVADAVSLRELPATVTSLLRVPSRVRFPGSSLARYWLRRTTDHGGLSPILSELEFAPNLPQSYPVSKGNMISTVEGRYHYIRNGDGKEQVYDIETDHEEAVDLANTEEGRQALNHLGATPRGTFEGNHAKIEGHASRPKRLAPN